MYTKLDAAVAVLDLLIEGMGVGNIERLENTPHHGTILTLIALAGERCQKILNRRIRNIPCQDVQCGEIWGFVQKKEAHKWPWEAHDNRDW